MSTPDYEKIRADIRKLVDEVIRSNAEKVDEQGLFRERTSPRSPSRLERRSDSGRVWRPRLDHVAPIAAEETAGPAPRLGWST